MDIATLIDLLDEYGFADSDSGLKLAAIQGAIWQIEGHKPWPFLEASVDLNFTGSSGLASNLPADFRASLRLKDLVSGARVLPIRLDDAEDYIGKDYTETGDRRDGRLRGVRDPDPEVLPRGDLVWRPAAAPRFRG